MENLWLPVRYLLMLVTVMLLGIVAPSIALANPYHNTSSVAATSSNNGPEATAAQQQQTQPQVKAKPKAVTKPREKSLLDPQSENSPVNYLRKAFTCEDESTDDIPVGSGTVTQAVKLLIAAALSTIM